ncbi:ShlB/FhaC/HecB family hemolysin secretion/activation protein [Xenorhabdus sp. KJ12.1]|uniref:ShlB/FhaC/HecB family hemolysin secretion/activation protein n=1 Tax=Xenorhabdus sp. KJ12.1 TaxID=1851571 RepID=UPI000C04D7D3|nr:ShlB/FhaC/HecB family hemolysin secretion/activation protein [Xenorhabdus sp. KJ12.1]PHM72339.1 putative hemolysin activator ShlB-type [Xenorhabdus sp. KJ12.1]
MKNKKVIDIVTYLSLMFSGGAFALNSTPENISPLDQEIINQKQKTILEEAQRKENMGEKIIIPQATRNKEMSDGESTCQLINHIDIEGAENIPFKKQASLIQPYLSKCLTINDLNALTKDITNYYLKKGYITSAALIKPQSVIQGDLTISVVEGKINSITIDDEHLLALKLAFPNMTGKILNLRDIEQGFDQINRLSSYQVNIDIQPTQKVGYFDVVLKRISSQNPLRASLSLDNNGQKNYGTNQLSTTVDIDNPLRLADLWTFSVNRNSDFRNGHKTWYVTSGVSIPYGYWLFGYQYSWNKSFQDMLIDNAKFRYEGKGQSHNLKAVRTLYRDGKQKLALNMNFTRRNTENGIGDVKFSINSPTLSTMNIGLNYSSTLFGGYFTFNPTITKGLKILGATEDNSFPDTPKSRFHKVSMSANYFKPLKSDIYYLTSVYGQYSPDHLYASEKISLGGQYSVRGFKEQNIIGNKGGYWRNEINWKIKRLPVLGEISVTGSLDTGWIKNEKNRASEGGNITGTSLGIFLNSGNSHHSFVVGKPLNHPKHLKPDNWVIYWSTSLNF